MPEHGATLSGWASFGALVGSRSVAVVGATERTHIGSVVLRNFQRLGFDGRLAAVNPKYSSVAGVPCVPSLQALDDVPELVVVVRGTEGVPAVLEEAEALGVRWACVPAGGENEGPQDAARLARFLADPVRSIRILGPNCDGVVALPERFSAYIGTVPDDLRDGSVSVISQSGGVLEAFASHGSRIGFRLLASVGNQAHISVEDVLEFILEDGGTRAVCIWQEGMREPERFLRLLSRAAYMDVRVGILWPGRTQRARAAVATHTGAMIGDLELWDQLARRQGAVPVATVDQLLEFAVLAQHPRRPTSGRIWIASNSGGQALQLSDEISAVAHISLPQPTETQRRAFRAAFPDASELRNPLDLWAIDEWEAACREGLRPVVEHGRDATLVLLIDASAAQGAFEGSVAATLVRAAARAVARHPQWRVVHLSQLNTEPHADLAAALAETAAPSIRGAAGVQALVRLLAPTGLPIGEAQLAGMRPAPEGGARMTHDAALAVLEHAQIEVPRTELVAGPDGVAEAVRALRPPLVVKAVGPAHRSRIGGVAVGVAPDDVEDVCRSLAGISGCSGFEIAEQISADLELLVNVGIDRQLGARATLGVGGALAQRARRAVSDLAPLEPAEALQLLRRLIGTDVDRAAARAWTAAVCDLLLRLSRLVRDGAAAEVEINPLAVNRYTARVVALDVIARHPAQGTAAGGSRLTPMPPDHRIR